MTPRYPTLRHSLKLIKHVCPEALTDIVDIGAQRKTPFLMEECKDGFHHLFEPVTLYHDELRQNYEAANLRFTVYGVAVSDTDGIAYLHNYSEDGSGKVTHSYLSDSPEYEHGAMKVSTEEVRTATLSSLFRDRPLATHHYVIKLDVDGIEDEIIKASEAFVRNAAFVIVEASLGRRNLVSRMQLIENLEFRLFDMADFGYYFGQMSQCDLVFINEDLRNKIEKFRPWQKTDYQVRWNRWQHGFTDLENAPFDDPFAQE